MKNHQPAGSVSSDLNALAILDQAFETLSPEEQRERDWISKYSARYNELKAKALQNISDEKRKQLIEYEAKEEYKF